MNYQLVKIRQGNLSIGPILEEYTQHPVEERIFQKKIYFTNGALKEKVYHINNNYIVIQNSPRQDRAMAQGAYIIHLSRLPPQQRPGMKDVWF